MKSGDRVKVSSKGRTYEGVLMPSTTDCIVIKLDNGYNIGIKNPEEIIVLEEKSEKITEKEEKFAITELTKPEIAILSTGGTIASKVDYRTGAVTSQFDAQDILTEIPELMELARFRAKLVYNILSENMKPEYWIKLARAVYEEIEKEAYGIIITHGTDTMTYSAAAISFMLRTPVPIVFVGSQRSSDRPSSDSAMNAICASKVAVSDIGEVCVVMHGTSSDDYCLVHRGCKVRKMHTSRRDAFKSINAHPIALVRYPSLDIQKISEYKKRGEEKLKIMDRLEDKCALVKYTPGAEPDIIDFYVDKGYRGIVIEGTGLGHVGEHWIPSIKRAVEEDVVMVITSQCLFGRVCDRVYDTGRDMLRAGVIEGEDMLPEVALVKLMWLLGNYSTEEAKKLVNVNIAGEISERSLHDYYTIK